MENNQQADRPTRTNLPNTRPTIGYLAYGIEDHVGEAIWTGIVEAARQRDVNLLCFLGEKLHNPNGFLAQANVLYDLVDPDRVDGLVIWTSTISTYVDRQESVAFCEGYHPLPMVSLGTALAGIPSVLLESYQGMREMMSHLIEVHGYRRLAFIRGPENHPYAQERYRAYTDTLAEYGLLLDPNLVTPPGDWGQTRGFEMIHLLLDVRGLQPQVDFEVVVTASDVFALGALEAFQRRGMRVPGEVGVVGFNDMAEGRVVTPPLTSVAVPAHTQGEQALEMVLAILAGEQVPEQVVLPGRLVVRRSCGCADAAVVQAEVKRVKNQKDHPAPKATLGAVFETQREGLISEMVQAAQNSVEDLTSERAQQLVKAFTTEIDDEAAGTFLATLEEILTRVTTAGGDAFVWQNVMSVLRRYALSHFDDRETLYRVENLVQQARVLISEITRRVQLYREVQARQYTQTIRSIGQALIATFDMAKLGDILVKEFPALDIPSCYLSLYEDPQTPTGAARLILAYDHTGQLELASEEKCFPASRLVSDRLLVREERYSMVVMSLYFEKAQQGLALFEMGPLDGATYGTLRGQISSALQGALLLQEREEAKVALEKAYAEVEQQVKERTAELQHEIAERERLQQEVIEAQRRAIQELSTPVIPVLEGIIIMPLIGSIDSLRARDITRALLAGISRHRAKVVIIDVTGVPLVDSGVANHLNKSIQAARLKGARTIVAGISEAVAETIVDLGIDWSRIETMSDLQTGLRSVLTGSRQHRESKIS